MTETKELDLKSGEHRAGPTMLRRPRRKPLRKDIQALRAVAVGLVVLNHLWPNRATGGYVGVDIFFVISGFLITSHLAKELTSTSGLAIARFYARRIKRLLPAAFLVLILGSVAVAVWVPYSEWTRTAREVMMSALYVGNWSLAAQSVDYSALTNNATIAQHYWSLSVEEQFYLLWPLVLLGLYKLGQRWSSPRTVLLAGVALAALASLAYSVYFTAVATNPAYFVTPVRVWEFAAGAIVALLAAKISLSRFWAMVAAAAGWLAVAVTAISFNQDTQFPGWAALLPVLGTVAVIVAGIGMANAPFSRVLAVRPVQLMGNISYSIYLWHWPMIVVAPYLLGSELNSWHKLGIILVCIPLAWLTKVLVEDQGKSWKMLGKVPRSTFGAMIVGMMVLALVSGGLAWGGHMQEAQAEAVQSAEYGGPCHGPAALTAKKACPDPLGPAAVTVMADANKYYAGAHECAVDPTRNPPGVGAVAVCDYSDGDADATTVWLTGDSHAEQWKLPLLDLARKNHWKLTYSLVGGCPIGDVTLDSFEGKKNPSASAACRTAGQSIAAMIEHDRPDKVFYSTFARQELLEDGSGRSQQVQYSEGLAAFWQRWADAGSTVYVLADPPLNGLVRDSKCVAMNPNEPLKCAVDRSTAQPVDPLLGAVAAMANPHVRLIDLTDHFCDTLRCYGVVGNVAVYYDANHLNGVFSKLMAPFIERKL
ncbi:acyltransferase family protein [Arthrobacter psychrochitiniphilus]|uniref:acyltransferase family protein n=1 Tax=Arthrobacter psychrochitiniphilus TaxID=291045 RepID=UPI003F7B5DC8